MNKLTITIAATVINGALAASGFAAGVSNHACAPGASSASGIIGKIVQAKGDVLFSGAKGYTEATAGSKLVPGSQVSVGDAASAKISVGSNCNLPIGENSIATLSQPNGATGNIKVSISSTLGTSPNGAQEGLSTQASGGIALGVIGGGVAGGAAATAGGTASQNEDKNPQKLREGNTDFVKDAEGNFIAVGGGTNAPSQ